MFMPVQLLKSFLTCGVKRFQDLFCWEHCSPGFIKIESTLAMPFPLFQLMPESRFWLNSRSSAIAHPKETAKFAHRQRGKQYFMPEYSRPNVARLLRQPRMQSVRGPGCENPAVMDLC
jgi:hypothetical protein